MYDNVKGMSCVEIASVTASEMASILDQLANVYRGAFTVAPHAETEADIQRFVSETLPRHAARDGFRLVVAREDFHFPGGDRPMLVMGLELARDE